MNHFPQDSEEKQDTAGIKVIPPVAFAICLCLGLCLNTIWPWPLPLPSPEYHIWIGLFIGLDGLIFGIWGIKRFHIFGVNLHPNTESSSLVTSGAYELSRNPMYVGTVLILFAMGVGISSLWVIFSVCPLFVYFQVHVIPREEAYLTRTFGEDYTQYCRTVRRWL